MSDNSNKLENSNLIPRTIIFETIQFLTETGIQCSSIHSGLDVMARTEAIKQFSAGRIRVLLVTDVAARGVDIPLLDNVINYHFPPQPKLFLHRVGTSSLHCLIDNCHLHKSKPVVR